MPVKPLTDALPIKPSPDVLIEMRLKHIISIIGTVCLLASAATYGYFDLRATALKGANGVDTLTAQVARIQCLTEQNNNYNMYKILPKKEC